MAFAQPPLSPGAVALVQTSNAGPFRSSPPHRSGPKKDTFARNSANRRRLWYKAGLGGPRFGIKPGPVEHCLRPFEIALHLPGPHTRAKSRLLAVGGQNPARRGLSAGGRWIRTTGTAAQKPWISGALRALRGYRRGSETIPPDGSALVLLRLEPLHRARLGYGLSRLWLAALRGGFGCLFSEPRKVLRPDRSRAEAEIDPQSS